MRHYHVSSPVVGFTLLELLVALVLLALVGLVTAGGLKLGGGAWRRSEQSADNAEAIEAAQRLLRQQLAHIYPAWRVERDTGHVMFDGAPGQLSFVGSAPAQFAPAGNWHFHLGVDASHALQLGWDPGTAPASDQPTSAALLPAVSAIALSYFGPDDDGQSRRWRDDWIGHRQLPDLIRLNVQFPPGDRRVWPELVVHPEIMVDTGCIFDPISHNCRGR